MNSDPADNVYPPRIDADPTNPGDQPNPVLTNNTDSAENDRPSAIERQRVAIQSAATRHRADQNTPPPTRSSRFAACFDGLRNLDVSRFGRRAALVLLLIAVSLLLMFSASRALKKETVPQAELAQVTKTLQKVPASGASSEMDAANAIAVPISDVSLRVRPELLQQLVAIYRLRLVDDPNNSEAMATLSRMKKHSLAELDVISATESTVIVSDSLRRAVKLFPELAYDPHYRSIATFVSTNENNKAHSQRLANAEPAVVTQQPAPATPPAPAKQPAQPPVVASTSTTQPPAPATTPTTQPPTVASTSTIQPPAAVAPRKPQVRVISLTPGIIRKDRFIPSDGGNVFRLNIGYRHRDNPLVNQPGAGLVAQLSESGSSKLLAEVPVEITGSSGEKSFLIDTSEKGRMGKFYKLNFIVDGNVLPSHTILVTRQ